MATGTAMSTKMESDILSRWLKNTTTVMSVNSATSQYLAIGTTGYNTGIAEPPTSDGYARVQVTFGAVGGATSGPATISGPSAATTFGPNTNVNWGSIGYFGIYDASTSGNLLFWGSLTATVSIAVNDQFQFAASAITLQAD